MNYLPGEIITSGVKSSPRGQNSFIRKLLHPEEGDWCLDNAIFTVDLLDFGWWFFHFGTVVIVIHFFSHGEKDNNRSRRFDSVTCVKMAYFGRESKRCMGFIWRNFTLKYGIRCSSGANSSRHFHFA